jgi:hypothetical protein
MAMHTLEENFTKDKNVFIVIEAKDGEIFTRETLAAIEELTAKAWKTPHSMRIDAITNFQYTHSVGDDLFVDDLVQNAATKNKRFDGAVRWSHTINRFDIGLSHFNGTNREPKFVPVSDDAAEPKFKPFYEIIHQTGLDLQITYDDILWKIEAIRRQSNFQTIFAFTAGFEYSLRNIQRTGTDIGFLGEYLFDDRGSKTPNGFKVDEFYSNVAGKTFDRVSTEIATVAKKL